MNKKKSEALTDLYYEELAELNTPYTEEEIEIHSRHRQWKSCLEMIHAHNWKLIILANKWIDYLSGKCKRPVKKICKYVNPMQGADINNACAYIRELVDLMCEYGEGNCPRVCINTDCSRSTSTLIDRLDAIKHSAHLTRAECAIAQIFSFIVYEGEPRFTSGEYREKLLKLSRTFIGECTTNAEELADFTARCVAKLEGKDFAAIYEGNAKPISKTEALDMFERAETTIHNECAETRQVVKAESQPVRQTLAKVEATTTTINNRDKKYRRKTKAHFTIEQQDGIYRQWMIAKQDPAVKALSGHKSSHEAAIIQFRKEFAVWGANTTNDLKKALKARLARLSKWNNSSSK